MGSEQARSRAETKLCEVHRSVYRLTSFSPRAAREWLRGVAWCVEVGAEPGVLR